GAFAPRHLHSSPTRRSSDLPSWPRFLAMIYEHSLCITRKRSGASHASAFRDLLGTIRGTHAAGSNVYSPSAIVAITTSVSLIWITFALVGTFSHLENFTASK